MMKENCYFSAEEITAMLISAEDQAASLSRIFNFMEQGWEHLSFRVMKKLQEDAEQEFATEETADDDTESGLPPMDLELFEVFCGVPDVEEGLEEELPEALADSRYLNALLFRKLFRQLAQSEAGNQWEAHQLAARAFLSLRQAFLEAGEDVKPFASISRILSEEAVEVGFNCRPQVSEEELDDSIEFLPDELLFDDGEDDPWD